jgi:hypothetical protein
MLQHNWLFLFRLGVAASILIAAKPLAVDALAALSSSSSSSPEIMSSSANFRVIKIPRAVWKQAALDHQLKIRALLQPAMLAPDNLQHRRQRQGQYYAQNNDMEWTALDSQNPVCNFLIEYYGLKGSKGTKRLARWSPSPNLLSHEEERYNCLESLLQNSNHGACDKPPISSRYAGVFLEEVTEEDLATTLQLRGALLEAGGALYSPSLWFQQKQTQDASANTTATPKSHAASAFLWYRAILEQTLRAEPILHCHGLHEWAMQYQPEGAPPPPSAKYQAHLPLRVSRHVINDTVEHKGISCTHVDALRFFAPAAGRLNHHGDRLERIDQLRLEQPACGT